jgi:peptidoglycan-associated lipoprotein
MATFARISDSRWATPVTRRTHDLLSQAKRLGSTAGRFASALMALALIPALANAQSPTGDRPGFWGARNPNFRDEPVRPLPTYPSLPRPDATTSSSPSDRDAARLYADARADLDQAAIGAAQRKLELLVARFPNSPLADVARRDLQRLYSAATAEPASPTLRVLSVSPAALQPPPAEPRVDTPSSKPAPALPIYSVRQATEDFRQNAGDRVFFANGASDVDARTGVALEAQARWLARYPSVRIAIHGHADDVGGDAVNDALAQARAKSVKLRLNDLGIAADRISVDGFGRSEVVASCTEPACTAQNRRVVTVITQVPAGIGFDPPQQVGRQLIGQPGVMSARDVKPPQR